MRVPWLERILAAACILLVLGALIVKGILTLLDWLR